MYALIFGSAVYLPIKLTRQLEGVPKDEATPEEVDPGFSVSDQALW